MKNNRLTVTSWDADTAFAVNASTTNEFSLRRCSEVCRNALHKLKEAITSELVARFEGSLGPEIVRQVVNEANALASATGFPGLILPTLAEERVLAVSRQKRDRRSQAQAQRLAI